MASSQRKSSRKSSEAATNKLKRHYDQQNEDIADIAMIFNIPHWEDAFKREANQSGDEEHGVIEVASVPFLIDGEWLAWVKFGNETKILKVDARNLRDDDLYREHVLQKSSKWPKLESILRIWSEIETENDTNSKKSAFGLQINASTSHSVRIP